MGFLELIFTKTQPVSKSYHTMSSNKEAHKKRVIDVQCDIIKQEIEIINQLIARHDNMTQTSKNWAILIWTGSIGLLLGDEGLRQIVIFTAVFPGVFWYLDAHLRRIQNRSIYRQRQISNFLNDERLSQSFKEGRITKFKILDPTGKQHEKEEGYLNLISIKRTMHFEGVKYFYMPMMAISIIIGIVFIVVQYT